MLAVFVFPVSAAVQYCDCICRNVYRLGRVHMHMRPRVHAREQTKQGPAHKNSSPGVLLWITPPDKGNNITQQPCHTQLHTQGNHALLVQPRCLKPFILHPAPPSSETEDAHSPVLQARFFSAKSCVPINKLSKAQKILHLTGPVSVPRSTQRPLLYNFVDCAFDCDRQDSDCQQYKLENVPPVEWRGSQVYES